MEEEYIAEMDSETDYYVWKNVDPFYTYPQTWNGEDNLEPYLKVIFPWVSDVKGSAEFHYKLVLHDPTDKGGVFTLKRNCFYQVEATIEVLGGTENDYVVVDVKCSVANWADPGWLSGKGLNSARFFKVPLTEIDVYGDEPFDIPVSTNGSAKVYIQKVEFKDYSGASTTTVTKTFNKPAGTAFTTTYTVAASSFAAKYNEHDYTVTFNGSDKYNKKVTFEHGLTDIYIVRDVTIYIEKDDDPNQNEIVIIHHHPAIELKKQNAGDVFVNGYFAWVVNSTDRDGNPFGTLTETYNGKSYYHSPVGGTWNTRGSYFQPSNNAYVAITARAGVGNGVSQDFFTTDITITAFDDGSVNANNKNDTYDVQETTRTSFDNLTTRTYSYKIGDPRVTASSVYSGWSLLPYLYGRNGNNALTDSWSSPGSIMICGQGTNNRNIIAPHLLVSSGLNYMQSTASLENVVKRAATYQEAGYPAGRWRLPSEAEIAFIYARQTTGGDGTIPNLFADRTSYWAGSGRIVQISNGNVQIRAAASNDAVRARFVYDLWYWGDETLSSNQYHANGHIE